MRRSSEKKILVVAEKPSVARDIARVLGSSGRRKGYIAGERYDVSWAIGHLVEIAEPGRIQASWRRWDLSTLPMIPTEFPLVVRQGAEEQYAIVERLLRDPIYEEIVCATDAGREGELIFRDLIAKVGIGKVRLSRLFISSLTDEAIARGFASLRPLEEYDGLYHAAYGRSRADWLVGMNLSRYYSLRYEERLSVGRVQTPTLSLVVERERAIRDFTPEDYLEIRVNFEAEGGGLSARLEAPSKLAHPDGPFSRLPNDRELAESILARIQNGKASIQKLERKRSKIPPRLLYDLAELQREANRAFGFTAKRTLDAAQSLYERYKRLSYPRTDSRHLSSDIAKSLPEIVAAIRAPYEDFILAETGSRPLGKRFVDDRKVSDHHAIIPTGKGSPPPPGSDEARIEDLVNRRLLAAYQPDRILALTRLSIEVESEDGGVRTVDRLRSRGLIVEEEGFMRVERRGQTESREVLLPSGLKRGDALRFHSGAIEEKQTKPPTPFDEAKLLTAMERAGESLDEEELSEAMKERGLGTPATRAAIVETLIQRGYLFREGRTIRATARGERLIELVDARVKSPKMTGEWEARLRSIEKKKAPIDPFMIDIEAFIRDLIGTSKNRSQRKRDDAADAADQAPDASLKRRPHGTAAASERRNGGARATRPMAAHGAHRPRSMGDEGPSEAEDSGSSGGVRSADRGAKRSARKRGGDYLEQLLKERFKHPGFRKNQRAICESVAEGRDTLVVMPTGAGKSLCYQLPGLARGGTTLVVSPLIALIEDQVEGLLARGMRADRFHSGRSREESREAYSAYLRGELDFLFVAPERFALSSFIDLLERRAPTLIAVDEAHCISQWGHDFRPDYRALRERLAPFQDIPRVALTATATPAVQDDIAVQLGLRDARRFILGFRRLNIAVEAAEMKPSQRPDVVMDILSDPARRPAIVYAPTRKETEKIASALGVPAYHAGLSTERRGWVQDAFLRGSVDVIVATIAFGMGIDKSNIRTVIHTALPATLEGYYQEIGRAGRDGAMSRAILLHGPSDRRTHDFFFERDYPSPLVLGKIHRMLEGCEMSARQIGARADLKPELAEKAIEKLLIHGGIVEVDGRYRQGSDDFLPSYAAQRAHRKAQLDHVIDFAEGKGCRMRALVNHFGDREDSGEPCGMCDRCAPGQRVVRTSKRRTSARPERSKRFIQDFAEQAGLDGDLIEALREYRLRESRERQKPAYTIFSDKTLFALAALRPRDQQELLEVPGIGKSKAEKFGEAILRVIRER